MHERLCFGLGVSSTAAAAAAAAAHIVDSALTAGRLARQSVILPLYVKPQIHFSGQTGAVGPTHI